jgi:Zn-finger nucleic acid-binding protein
MPTLEAGTQTLTCPKCGSEMRSYERNGVLVDQCTGCKGIFLDRGELERLTEAENTFYERERPREHEGGRPKKTKKQKARSFLENLMEGGE